MPSANGYKLTVDGFEVVASWAAPFFVLVRNEDRDDKPERPLLIHCEDRRRADLHLRFGGMLLDSQFVEVV